jgi:hypothetical protein
LRRGVFGVWRNGSRFFGVLGTRYFPELWERPLEAAGDRDADVLLTGDTTQSAE